MDLFDIQKNKVRRQIFYAGKTPWVKPNNITMLHIVMIAGGGGGGSGEGDSAAVATYGGGGGSAGASATFMIPAALFPDSVIMHVGFGGAGGAGVSATNVGLTGSNGQGTYIKLGNREGYGHTGEFILLYVYPGGAPGTGGGIGGGLGTGGLGVTITFGGILVNYTFRSVPSGSTTQAGGNGTSSVGSIINITYPVDSYLSGGSGGGTCNGSTAYGGGAINTVAGLFNNVPAGLTGDAQTMIRKGLESFTPLLFTGGTGGFSGVSTTPGKRGGDGAYGCGGGGGGASRTNSGEGGKGGDGLIILTYW